MRYFVLFFVILLFVQCSFTKKINSGEAAYDYKQYAVAVDMLKQEYGNSKSREQQAYDAYLLGMSYQFLLKDKDALFWFNESVEKGYGAKALRELSFSFKKNERYNEAIGAFSKLKREGGNKEFCDKEIYKCKEAIRLKNDAQASSYKIIKMGLNSVMNEYSPVLYKKNFLVYTSDGREATGTENYKWTGNKFSDIFIFNKSGSGIPSSFDEKINTDVNEGTACFSINFKTIYFTRCKSKEGDDYCNLMYSVEQEGSWSEAKEVFEGMLGLNYGQPTLIERDSVLVFASNKNYAESGYDLYYSVLEEEGWSNPEPMPTTVNTSGNERFPSSDGDTLYFSSDYLPGLGGLDIFKTYLIDGEKWAKPINIGYPINKGSDDFGLIIDRTIPAYGNLVMQGFFASDRDEGEGDNIFRFSQFKPEKEIIEIDTNTVIEEIVAKTIRLALRIGEFVYENPEDNKSKKIAKDPIRNQEIVIITNDTTWTIVTDKKGRAFTELLPQKNYAFSIRKEEYLFATDELSTHDIDIYKISQDTTINKEILIDRIIKNKEIVLADIYYNYNKADIRKDAKPGLDYLVSLMKNNPTINIQLSAHTDCRGFESYNLDLSQRRAEAVVQYVVSQGIDANRLTPVGYGEGYPAIKCDCLRCSEEEHQTNRRTTFKVID